MIILRNKIFSEKEELREKGRKKVNTLKGIGTGLSVITPTAVLGTIASISDAEDFERKHRNRIYKIEDRQNKYYKDLKDKWLNRISERSKAIQKKIDSYKSGDLIDDFIYKFKSTNNLGNVESKLINEAFDRYDKNIDRVNSRVKKMNDIVKKAANKRLNRNLALTGIASVGLGTAAGIARKKKLDNKKNVKKRKQMD